MGINNHDFSAIKQLPHKKQLSPIALSRARRSQYQSLWIRELEDILYWGNIISLGLAAS